MTVFDNAAYPLKTRRTAKEEIRRAVTEALATMQMDHLAERPATMLSGGQQQRLALARAIVGNPRLLLLDEPLSNLDAKLRELMRFEIKRLQSELGVTTIYVTHDQSEALALSDEIAVMRDGAIVQRGTPVDIYYRPNSEYVADFIGSTNLVAGVIAEPGGADRPCVIEVEGVPCQGTPQGAVTRGGAATLAIRPEEIGIVPAGAAEAGAPNTLTGVVKSRVFLGDTTDFLIAAAGADIRVRASGPRLQTGIGDEVALSLPREGCLVFPRAHDGAGAGAATSELLKA
jgi:iron(III) transport system ATP-binding protein